MTAAHSNNAPDQHVPFELSGQYIWPDARHLIDNVSYPVLPVFRSAISGAKGLFGVVSGLHNAGIDFLEECVSNEDALALRLIVAVWPACPTIRSDLRRLLALQERFPERLQFRVQTSNSVLDHGLTMLCVSGARSKDTYLILGKTTDLGTNLAEIGEGGVLRADAGTVEAFHRRFLWRWSKSTELSAPAATEIPTLALPEGTVEAARIWSNYQASVANGVEALFDLVAKVDPETGEVTLVSESGEPVADPTADLGFAKMDPMAMWIADLYPEGQIVSIDKTSRIPPVDVPVNPSAFGDSADMTRGDVSRKVSMRASVIKEADLKEIEKHRSMVRTILNRLSFSLSDGLRWVPDAVRDLLTTELENADSAGRAALLKAMGGEKSLDINAFVESRKPDLAQSLKEMAAALGTPNADISRVLEDTVSEAKTRLERAKGGSLLPTLSWTRISFSADEDAHASPWGQAATFLLAIVRFPREAMTNGFFMRGLSCNIFDLIEAMNVANDDICKDLRAKNLSTRCRQELDLIQRVADKVSDPKVRCRLLRLILDGKAAEIDGELQKLPSENAVGADGGNKNSE